MCGRYVSTSTPAALAAHFEIDEVRIEHLDERFNVTPRSAMPVVARRDDHRVLDRLRWGLVPSWAKEPSIGDRLINARAETLADKPAFRRAFRRRRCLVPADGFYEWQAVEGRRPKQPWYILRRDHAPLAFAGLWESWHDPADPDAAPLRTFVIVTTGANELLAPIHDRMPVVLAAPVWDTWLDPANDDVASLQELLVPAPAADFECYEIATTVNRTSNEGRELIAPKER